MGHISEISYGGNPASDFVEVSLPEGTDPAGWSIQIYNNGGNAKRILEFGEAVTTIDGQDIYLFEGKGGLKKIGHKDAVALVDQDGGVLQFVSFAGNTVRAKSGDARGESSTDIGMSDSGESLYSTDGGSSYTSTSRTPGTIPCFGPGTRILTPSGWHPVDSLRPGQPVCLAGGGSSPVRWASCREGAAQGVGDGSAILLRAGALGPRCPGADLVLSGQHRVLVGPGAAFSGRFAENHLVPAKALTGAPRIREIRANRPRTWHHFALQRHAVVIAEGLAVESLYLGPVALAGLSPREALRLRGLFGGVDENGALNGPPAAPFLGVGEARRRLQSKAPQIT